MRRLRLGDTVWVTAPKRSAERKLGTITKIDKKGDEPRYTVEWETYMNETEENLVRYSSREIVLASHHS